MILSDIRTNLFQIACVDSVESIQCITVYIQYPDYFTLFYYRYYYFRFRVRTTSNVSGKLFYIRNNQCMRFFPGCAANSSAKADAGTGNGTLKRTQYEFILFHKVKTYPEETEVCFSAAAMLARLAMRSVSVLTKACSCGSNSRYFSSLFPVPMIKFSAISFLFDLIQDAWVFYFIVFCEEDNLSQYLGCLRVFVYKRQEQRPRLCECTGRTAICAPPS